MSTPAAARTTTTHRRVSYLRVVFDRIGPVPAKATAVAHTVTAGDTLLAIGRRYGVTLPHLRELNALTTDTLTVGQVVTLVPTLPPLTVHIPHHTGGRTAEHVDAMIAYLTLPVREYVRMSPLVPATFTVTISLDANGTGTVLVNGGRHGTAKISDPDATDA